MGDLPRELRAKVQGYLDGDLSVEELHEWAMGLIEALIDDAVTVALAGAVFDGVWTCQDGFITEAQLREELRQELATSGHPTLAS